MTVGAAAAATALDATLLERRHGFFTGGFLAVDHLTGAWNVAAFVAISLLADAAVIGLAIALVLWLCGKTRLGAPAARFLAMSAAIGPICLANVVAYQITAYVGDLFNLALLYDLTGRHASELLAVGAAHFGSALAMAGGGAVVVVGVAWTFHRRSVRSPRREPLPARVLLVPMTLFLAGTAVAAATRHESAVLDNGLRRKPSAQMLEWLSATLTDFDRDGYGWLDFPADPRPWDPRSFPYAVDEPGNGIDEDGVGGDLPPGAGYVEPGPASDAWKITPDVVFVVLESFRADLVGASLGGTEVTPVLNHLAAAGASARHAYSHNGYTSQSRHHLFSGSVAGVRQGTLIDDFKRNGYQVAYFSGQDESFGGPEFAVGFDRADVAYDARVEPDRRYSTYATAGSLAVPASLVQQRIAEFLAHRTSRQPLFLYVNFEDTHFPYDHAGLRPILSSDPIAQAQIVPGREAQLRATYANTAANVDRAVGDVLDMVRRTRGAQPGVIVAADHGESLFDDGILGHGVGLTDAQTRIPLIVAHLPMVIEEPFGQASLRDAIGRALAAPGAAGRMPSVRESGRSVFQYLGILDRPAQIALTRASGRIVFDFRSRLVQVASSPEWREPEALTGGDAARFLELVRTWERMLVAKRRGANREVRR